MVRVPLEVDVISGKPIASITSNRLSSPYALYMGDQVIKYIDDPEQVEEYGDEFATQSHSLALGVPPLNFTKVAIVAYPVYPDEDWLGIGPRSDLVNVHQSVNFIQSDIYELLLHLPIEVFMSFCDPVPVFHLPFEDEPMTVFVESIFGEIRLSAIDYIFEFDRATFVELFATVIEEGLMSADGVVEVSRSISEHLTRFPEIRVSNQAHNFVLTVFDYIDSEGRFRIGVRNDRIFDALPYTRIFHFNPLLIPNMNVRSTNSGILLARSGYRAPRPTSQPVKPPRRNGALDIDLG